MTRNDPDVVIIVTIIFACLVPVSSAVTRFIPIAILNYTNQSACAGLVKKSMSSFSVNGIQP
jgi:hypothetical protein